MNAHAMTSKQPSNGLIGAIKQIPPHFLFAAMLFAMLWIVNEYFVSRKEYDKDQGRIEMKLNDMSGDIKEILKRGVK